jgi:protein-tyrosine kinase
VTQVNQEVIQSAGVANLQVITSGPIPPNPSELLGSTRMSQVIAELHDLADVVIFDSPPVLSATDAALLANRLDGTILVAESGRTRREAALRAVEQLQRAGANLIGGVLNRLQKKTGGYYYHYYDRYYHPDAEGGNGLDGGHHSLDRWLWWRKRPVSQQKD